MTRRLALALAALLALCAPAQAAQPAHAAQAAPPQGKRDGAAKPFQFGVIGHAFSSSADEALLKRAIAEVNQGKPVFVVATGIKAGTEPCSDTLYSQRRDMLDESARPLIVSLAGSDWSECRNALGRSNAIERLNRIREVFFPDGQSLGARKLALTRLSNTAKFRSYAENAYWQHGGVLFATLNLPARNNRFLPEAGRNSEYEDRLVANRAWLHRLFALAQRSRLDGVVLFSDGDVGVHEEEGFSLLGGFMAKRDGFAQIRKQVRALAGKYPGQVLLVDAQGGKPHADADSKLPPADTAIVWHGNLGHLSVGAEWEEIRVSPGSAALFGLRDGAAAQ